MSATLVAERAWGDRAAELVLVIRAVVAAELHLQPRDPLLDDLTQEVVRRALDGRERVRPNAPLRPWVLGIARHVAADEQRRRARLTSLDAMPGASIGLETFVDQRPNPETAAQQTQRLGRLRKALAQLPDSWRRALLLFHLEGLSYLEIARELSVPVGTVGTWIVRGRAQLLAAANEDDET